ncbi:MAG: DUF2071 domain-containing protein [Chloroflexota bacterium]
MTQRRRFLTAEWHYLAMLNYEIDPAILKPHVPAGTELDLWQGRTFASMVGFLFLKTKLLGVPIPFHQNFEEVNLRFYVRYKSAEGWRRGVVFIKEIVPRFAIAAVAQTVYGENYVALPMRHTIEREGQTLQTNGTVEYGWRFEKEWNFLKVQVAGEPTLLAADSEEAFITEHYWGYASQRNEKTVEYEVEHPSWRVWQTSQAHLYCNVAELYGPEFVESLSGTPSSAFLAEGSDITVYQGNVLTGKSS